MTSPFVLNEGHMSFKVSFRQVGATFMMFCSTYQQQALRRQSQGFNLFFFTIIQAQET